MAKRGKIVFGMVLALLLAVSVTGCDKIGGKKKETTEFVRGPEGLVMEFVPNYPQDKFIVSKPKTAGEGEPISVLIEVRNKGTYPPQEDPNNDPEHQNFGKGALHLSGFDDNIIDMSGLTKDQKEGLTAEAIKQKQLEGKSRRLGKDDGTPILYLPAASSVNPLGGIDTAEFDGKISADHILIDSYNPTILVTACYPYFTKSTPTVCIDPEPFDLRQEKVCAIGSQAVPNQGAPVAVTRIDQEAAAGKIQFKITIKNVGDGDVIGNKSLSDATLSEGINALLNGCNPNEGGRLDRKDFDRVKVEKIKVGTADLWNSDKAKNKCSPFADGTNDIVRLFNGEGFVICTLDVDDLGPIQSAYTTPIDIELRYAYRSTISKPIQIRKLETIG